MVVSHWSSLWTLIVSRAVSVLVVQADYIEELLARIMTMETNITNLSEGVYTDLQLQSSKSIRTLYTTNSYATVSSRLKCRTEIYIHCPVVAQSFVFSLLRLCAFFYYCAPEFVWCH